MYVRNPWLITRLPRQKQSFLKVIMQFYVKRCVICVSKKVEHLDKNTVKKVYERSYFVILSLFQILFLWNAFKKMLDNISSHRHFECGLKYLKDFAIILSKGLKKWWKRGCTVTCTTQFLTRKWTWPPCIQTIFLVIKELA